MSNSIKSGNHWALCTCWYRRCHDADPRWSLRYFHQHWEVRRWCGSVPLLCPPCLISLYFFKSQYSWQFKKEIVVGRRLQKCTTHVCPQDGSTRLLLKNGKNVETLPVLLLGIEIFNWFTIKHRWRLKRHRLRMLTGPQWACRAVWINTLWGSWGAAPTLYCISRFLCCRKVIWSLPSRHQAGGLSTEIFNERMLSLW